jgi:RecD/TraA family predicted helicase
MTTNHTQQTELIELNLEPVYEKFYNDQSCFGIYSCYNLDTKTESTDFLGFGSSTSYKDLTLTGTMPRLTIGKKYIARVEEKHHPKYGQQYQVHSIYSPESTTEEDEAQFIQFLVTEKQLKNILSVYPLPVTAIIEGTFDYKKVKGFGQKSYTLLKTKVEANYHNMKAMSVLGQFGIRFNQIKKLVEYYGSSELAIQQVFSDPYTLYREIDGVGFKKADEIARAIGFDFKSPKRILAGIMHSVEQEEQRGNTWGYISVVKENAEEVLGLKIENIDDFLDSSDFYVDKENDVISLKKTWQCECDIAEELYRLSDVETTPLFSDEEVTQMIVEIENKNGIQYTDMQKELFYKVNNNPISILTGAAGCGKSASVKGLLDIVDKANIKYKLFSPTAKASRVLINATGRDCTTVHRGLAWQNGEFTYNKDNPLDCQLLIIDEASMLDQYLFRSILRALPTGCRLVLIGDIFQLESIAIGNILNDTISSNIFPVIKLDKVFRQKGFSGILEVSTCIRNNEKFYSNSDTVLEFGERKDMRIWFDDKSQTTPHIVTLFKQLINKYPIEEIMVLCPTKNGNAGTKLLNSILQEIYNPPAPDKEQIDLKRCIFRVGDRVLHTKNFYDAEWYDKNYEISNGQSIFNGESGVISKIQDDEIYVDYGEKIIRYDRSIFDMLDLGYCLTTHKSQGSQSKVVIVGIDFSHYILLKRSLLYTAVTRASEKCFLVGEKKAISMACSNNEIIKKRTMLEGMLKNLDKSNII